MKDRQLAWANADVRKMIDDFIPAADEVVKLERGRGFVSDFYRKIATRHVEGLGTTQGTYIVTPSGRLLASGHTLDPTQTAAFLREGLQAWAELSKKERLGRAKGAKTPPPSDYPEDGLVLNVVLRKIYTRKPSPSRRGVVEWNQDFAWFRKAEAKSFLPSRPKKGDEHPVPKALIERLARYHFLNTVRAFSSPYPARCVEAVELKSTVLYVDKKSVSLRLEGSVRTSQDDLPRFGSTGDQAPLPRKSSRGYDARLLGYARFDRKTRQFTEFELIAFGTLRGGGARTHEDPVTLGVALTLAKRGPVDRVEPRHFGSYGWK